MIDFTPRRDVQAISHVNVVVDDIEVATDGWGYQRAVQRNECYSWETAASQEPAS